MYSFLCPQERDNCVLLPHTGYTTAFCRFCILKIINIDQYLFEFKFKQNANLLNNKSRFIYGVGRSEQKTGFRIIWCFLQESHRRWCSESRSLDLTGASVMGLQGHMNYLTVLLADRKQLCHNIHSSQAQLQSGRHYLLSHKHYCQSTRCHQAAATVWS